MIGIVCKFAVAIAGVATILTAQQVSAAINIDGSITPGEWSGAGVVTVNYNPAAPLGNFGAPTNENHAVGYDIYTKGDANYFYVGILAATNGTQNLLFANLYFDLNPSTGSDLGFEVFNDNAFIPGVPGNFSTLSLAQPILHAKTAGTATTPDMIEVAFPWSIFTSDPLSMGYTPATSEVQLRLSQSLGYSVAGGQSAYGDNRLGTLAVPAAAVPEASSILVFGLIGLTLAAAAKWRSFFSRFGLLN